MSNNNNNNNIINKMLQWGDAFCMGATIAAKDILMEEMHNVLDTNYYDQYIPIVYQRTDNFWNNSYSPILVHKSTTYEGGIRLSSDNMEEYYHSPNAKNPWSKSEIYLRNMEGLHGAYKQKDTPPFDKIIEFAKTEQFRSYVSRAGFEAAKKNII